MMIKGYFYKLCFALLIVFSSFSCSKRIDFQDDYLRLKDSSRVQLSRDIKEFNAYTSRPKPDGFYNATNNEVFLQDNIPLFLSSNENFTKVYNYRWWMISKHLKKYYAPDEDKDYWVFTEFFGVMDWASRSGAIVCPAGHQFYDTRWLRNPEYLKSYAQYYLGGSGFKMNQRDNRAFATYIPRPESHHYSSWMVDGTEAFLKIHPDATWRNRMLPHLEDHQAVWDTLFTVKRVGSKTNGMYKFLDLYDGMEFSIGAALGLVASKGNDYGFITDENWREYYLGWNTTEKLSNSKKAKISPRAFKNGYPQLYLVRPTLNCYSYGNTHSLGSLYGLKASETGLADDLKKSKYYLDKAKQIQQKNLSVLWNKEDQFFNTYTAGDNTSGIRDYEARVRESVGYTPWYFNMIPKNNTEYDGAWQFFGSEKGFNNTNGMTTAEIQHPYYNEQAYAWNGRGWPFQNSVVNKAYANYLKNYKTDVTDKDRRLLYTHIEKFVKLHGGQPNIGEWYIPSNGKAFGGVKDYFHSTFPDMLIEDLLGFTPSHDDSFTIQCLLLQEEWDYFYLGNLRYHGHDIDIIWKKDWDKREGVHAPGLGVWVDGKMVVFTESLNEKLKISLKKQ